MNFDEKLDMLYKYRPLLDKRNRLYDELTHFEEFTLNLSTHITPGSLDDIRTSGGKIGSNKVSAYSERDSLFEFKLKEFKNTDEELLKILKAINTIENIDFQNAVYAFFVQGMTYEEIGCNFHIAEITARWRRNKGIENMKI